MTHSSIKVANRILELARNCVPPIPITPLKIIKLVYVTNGWAHPILGERLVREDAEAWTYGPVFPDLYHAVRRYRAEPIAAPIPGGDDPEDFSDDEDQLISSVFSAYGKLSGIQLSNLTHLPNTPWSMTWDGGFGQNAVIPDELIADHYTRLSEVRSSDASTTENTAA